MTWTLPDGEPAAGPWTRSAVRDVLDLLGAAAPAPLSRPLVVAVDGRSASGKSVLADRLCAAVPASGVVRTDDLAWHHSFFDWADLLVTGVLEPVRRGTAVSFRPPAWDRRGREGAVEVPNGMDLLVVEGVGAGRREVAHLVDAVVWVQSDAGEAERRGIARDVASGVNGDAQQAVRFWREWTAQERVFLAHHRPWGRAGVVVSGTPGQRLGSHDVLVAPGPLMVSGSGALPHPIREDRVEEDAT